MKELPNYSITKILAEEIKDSHNNSTIKVTVFAGGVSDSFSVPSGASTGTHEAHELRDPVPEQARYGASSDGKGGMKKAIWNVENVITPALLGQDIFDQEKIDRIMIELDGTPNKDKLGGNSMIGVSIACAKVAAKVRGQEVYQYLQTLQLGSGGQALTKIKPSRKVPYLFINLIEGGKHTKNLLAFQEYHVIPNTEDVSESVDIAMKIQKSLKEIILRELGEESIVLGDEGGFAPKTSDIRNPLRYLTEAIRENNLQSKIKLALDTAASSFYNEGKYQINGKNISKEELMKIYESIIEEFDLMSIEDPFDEEDFDSFEKLKNKNKNLLVVGDDLTVTNRSRLKEAIKEGSINAIIIKPNQIGTLSETLEVMRLARDNSIELIISHRGEETNDDFIADLAYAFHCFGLKAGSPLKPERMVKYQRLIEILE